MRFSSGTHACAPCSGADRHGLAAAAFANGPGKYPSVMAISKFHKSCCATSGVGTFGWARVGRGKACCTERESGETHGQGVHVVEPEHA